MNTIEALVKCDRCRMPVGDIGAPLDAGQQVCTRCWIEARNKPCRYCQDRQAKGRPNMTCRVTSYYEIPCCRKCQQWFDIELKP